MNEEKFERLTTEEFRHQEIILEAAELALGGCFRADKESVPQIIVTEKFPFEFVNQFLEAAIAIRLERGKEGCYVCVEELLGKLKGSSKRCCGVVDQIIIRVDISKRDDNSFKRYLVRIDCHCQAIIVEREKVNG